ncbi:MAG: class I SAM-dependent methyltransferase [Pseudomonadota bacterium]|nr:class I SAM-dependent methyltransferase [Pseudomonadota bacterium]
MSGAWDQFWTDEQRKGGGGCLSARWQGIDAVQRQAWQAFARILPKGARVLDLATGDGRVMGWLVGCRRDLKPVGIDLAKHIPEPPKGCRSRGGIAMEALPFKDGSQDAVVSQFGVEYGRLGAVLREIARVSKRSARVGLMTHRLDGPILEHNRSRRSGLNWVLDDADLISKARASLALRGLAAGLPPAIATAPAEAKVRFGAGSGGWELAEAIVQTLVLGHRDRSDEVLRLLGVLEAKAYNEIGRINSLEGACRAVADSEALKALFATCGLRLEAQRPIEETGSGRAFADMWILRRL